MHNLKRCLVGIICVGALVSCKTTTGSDGYKMESPDNPPVTEVTVRMVFYPNDESLAASPRAPKVKDKLKGFSILTKDRKLCTIHIMDQTRRYQPEWLGHEMSHCIYGEFHP